MSFLALRAPGCTTYVLPLVSFVTPTSAGRASIPLTIPTDAGLIGFPLHLQWTTLDKAANSLGLVNSTAARIKIGRM